MKRYSEFFQTLHDETRPTGRLGRGTHYSVIRAVAWKNQWLVPLDIAHFHDLAIVWDEDHDERVIKVIEQLYFKNLLFPAIFVGERKGAFSLLIDDFTLYNLDKSWLNEYRKKVEEITQSLDDPWPAEVELGIVNDSPESVSLYLSAIKMLWNLGINES